MAIRRRRRIGLEENERLVEVSVLKVSNAPSQSSVEVGVIRLDGCTSGSVQLSVVIQR